MAKTKGTSRGAVIPVKVPAYWQIGILFPDGKKLSKVKCSLNELMNTYFIGLDKYLNRGYSPEQLLELYQKTFYNKGVKIQINYIDSYGHLWKGKVAWPREYRFIEYLNKRINDYNSKQN